MRSANDFIINPEDIDVLEVIGSGGQGYVKKGFLKRREKAVALKFVKDVDIEFKVLSNLRHKNIVLFYGETNLEKCRVLVMEYAEEGSLMSYLERNKTIAFKELLLFGRHIVDGLNYLHKDAPEGPVIHRDLKSKNVVISKDLVAKICDFGSSRKMTHSKTIFSSIQGTFGWMAPEVMKNGKVTEKCDVYSLGILLWEMITGEIPFKNEEPHAIMYGVCVCRRRPVIPEGCPEQYKNLILDCWKDDANERPTVADVGKRIDRMLGDEQLSSDVDRFLDVKDEWIEQLRKETERLKEECNAKIKNRELMLEEKDKEINNLKRQIMPADASKVPLQWSCLEVVQYINTRFREIDEEVDYSDAFMNNHIGGGRLLDMKDEDLSKIGITSHGHRMEILKIIGMLKEELEHNKEFPPLKIAHVLDNTANRQGKSYKLKVECGNTVIPPNRWLPLVFLSGDDVACSSVNYVEFRIQHCNPIRIDKPPYTLNSPKEISLSEPMKFYIKFKKNVLRPQDWQKEFTIDKETSKIFDYNITVVIDEMYTYQSSLSSAVSGSVMDMSVSERTTPPNNGAWANGSPFSKSSPKISCRPSPKTIQGNVPSPSKSPVLNHSKSSPAHMDKTPQSTDKRPQNLGQFNKSRSMTAIKSGNAPLHLDTPITDPNHPQFSKFREEAYPLLNSNLNTTDLNNNFRNVDSNTLSSMDSSIPVERGQLTVTCSTSRYSDSDDESFCVVSTPTTDRSDDVPKVPSPQSIEPPALSLQDLKKQPPKTYADILNTKPATNCNETPKTISNMPQESGGKQKKKKKSYIRSKFRNAH